jgi:hypothetical protein
MQKPTTRKFHDVSSNRSLAGGSATNLNQRQARAPGTKHYSPAAAKPTFGRVRVASAIKTAGIERFEAEVPELKQREDFEMV